MTELPLHSPPPAAAVADPASLAPGIWTLAGEGTEATFRVGNFWGLMTVRGRFQTFAGGGRVAADGSLTGRVAIRAVSLTTGNPKRDGHLRSPDFFDAERHPEVVVTITRGTPQPGGAYALEGTLEAAGKTQPLTLTATIDKRSPDSVTVTATADIDRTQLGMTWSPLGMASSRAALAMSARFDHQPDAG